MTQFKEGDKVRGKIAEVLEVDGLLVRLQVDGEYMGWTPAAAYEKVPEEGTLRIEGHWLVREVNEHTCGTGRGGYYGAHEPGCGLVPELDLSTLPGWREPGRSEAEVLWEAAADIKARIVNFRSPDADPQYMNALNDAWGLVANRARSAERAAQVSDTEGSDS